MFALCQNLGSPESPKRISFSNLSHIPANTTTSSLRNLCSNLFKVLLWNQKQSTCMVSEPNCSAEKSLLLGFSLMRESLGLSYSGVPHDVHSFLPVRLPVEAAQ